MPKPPSRLKGKGRFPTEWNLINDWFKALASTWFRSDGSVNIDVNQDHCLFKVPEPEIIRAVKANEDIPTEDEGECIVLNWDSILEVYAERIEASSIEAMTIIVRNDYGADITRGQKFLAGLTLDGNWESIGVGTVIVLGNLDNAMRRSETANVTLDSGKFTRIKDPGQIPRDLELLAGNRVTLTLGDPGILISYDCEETQRI